jgi:predicted HTH domain antitoxin
MKNITIPVDVTSDIMIALNENEKELKNHFQLAIAMMLFQEGKLTIGKAIQFSGLTRYEFEKSLTKNKIPISNQSIDQILSDIDKISDL